MQTKTSLITDDSGRQQRIKKTTVYKIAKHKKKSILPPQTLDKVGLFSLDQGLVLFSQICNIFNIRLICFLISSII